MKRIINLVLCLLFMFCSVSVIFAVSFDDSYCDIEFKGEKLWTSNIFPKKLSGHKYDSENGVYQYDWVHQIWDKEHKQLYVQERYTMAVNMKPILVNAGEMLNNVSYSIKVASYSDDRLLTQYSSTDDIPTPDGYSRMNIKVSGYDAVYIYKETKTFGDGNGVVFAADNHGNIYVPIVGSPNDRGKINTLKIECVINGLNSELFDSLMGDYIGLIKNLPCIITVNRQEKVFKEGATTVKIKEPADSKTTVAKQTSKEIVKDVSTEKITTKDTSDKKGISPVVSVLGTAAVAAGAVVALKVKSGKITGLKKNSKPQEQKSAKTEDEIKRKKYIDKLKEKYRCDDEKELKKEIMEKQIHNEKLGYIAQADIAYADAALDTAEKSKKLADVSADVVAELGGAKGKIAKNIYTGLTEFAEATGNVIAGQDAAEAFTEAVVDTSIGVIQNQADGFKQKYVANTIGGGAREFAIKYMETNGDVIKSIDAANDAVQKGAIDAVIDSVTDGLVDKAVGKAAVDAGKEAVAETLKSGVNASKAFSQDMIKDAVKE